jgi:mRNA interferase RelE/StbE
MTDPYTLKFKPSVRKDLHNVPSHVISSILSAIEELSFNPYPSGVVKLTDTDSYYRIRKGDYRIIYEVLSTERLICIMYIRHRKKAYRIDLS